MRLTRVLIVVVRGKTLTLNASLTMSTKILDIKHLEMLRVRVAID